MRLTSLMCLVQGFVLFSPSFACAAEQQQFSNVYYVPPAGEAKRAKPVEGALTFARDAAEIRFTAAGSVRFAVPFKNVTSLVYERTAKPRYAAGLLIAWPLLFTKSKQHFLTMQYSGADGQKQYAVMRLDKSNYQEVIAAAEVNTAVKVQRAKER